MTNEAADRLRYLIGETGLPGESALVEEALAAERRAGAAEERERMKKDALAEMEVAARDGRVAHLYDFIDILDAEADR